MRVSEILNEDKFSQTTFDIQRRKLNVAALIKAGALFITYPHGEDGWETDDKEDWSYSVVTLYNVSGGGWQAEAKRYLKQQSYDDAAKEINSSKPNLGSSDLIYDGKYNQILWSAKKLGMKEEQVFI